MKMKAMLVLVCLTIGAQVSFAEVAMPTAQTASGFSKAILVNLTQSKVIKDDKGVEKLVEASAVKPRDVIEYRVVYKNVSAKSVKSLIATLPIPSGLEYQAGSAKPSRNASMAADDAQYRPEPLVKRHSNGVSEQVPYNEYRYVRWDVGSLAPGASVEVVARAKVEAFSDKQAASVAVKSGSK